MQVYSLHLSYTANKVLFKDPFKPFGMNPFNFSSVLEVIFFNAQINYLTGRKDTAKQNSSFISALQSYLFLSKI